MSRLAGALLCLGLFALAIVGGSNLSCYAPPTPNCGFGCTAATGFACPPDYTCSAVDQICKLNTAPAGTSCQSDARPDTPSPDADTTAPEVVSTTPGDGATAVARGAPITVTFSRDVVAPDSSDFLVMDGPTQLPGLYDWNAATRTATFMPVPALPGGHVITVQLTPAIVTVAGNSPLAAFSFSFTTFDDEPPQLASSVPLDMSTAVPVNSTIVVTFSEPVTGVTGTSFTVANGATGLPGTIVASGDAMSYTFTPSAALPAGAQIDVALTAAITDLAVPANPLAPTTFSFTTQ